MTQTASFKEKFKTAFSFFKWELKACSSTIIVYSILAAVFTTIALTLTLVIEGYSKSSNSFSQAVQAFQVFSSTIVYYLTIIFTIIYTIRVYSYLHNKRKADLYGSLPVSRITLFLSKSVTAFVFSVIPALFFLGIISIISVCFGQPVVTELTIMYLKLCLGSLACISAYGLLAVCCGTSINAVIMFLVVCVAYPLSAIFIKGVVGGFFDGFYLGILKDNFIMNALNPLAAYDGINVIYWIIFTIVCTLGGCYLAKRRRYERAQSSFAYFLPCHIIKVLISFLVGMFLGTLFGSLNVLSYGLLGFIFGFILGSVPAFAISHLIFYKGFKNLLKTSIPLTGLIIVVIGTITLCNFDVFGYNDCIPDSNDVAKAGFVDLDNSNLLNENPRKFAKECCDDYSDFDDINNILSAHACHIEGQGLKSNERFGNVWYKMFASSFNFDTPQYCFGYTLKNGQTIKRIYSEFAFDYNDDINLDSIIYSKEYFMNYGTLFNTDTKELEDLFVTTRFYCSDVYNNNIEESKADCKKIIEAFKKDFEADKSTASSVLEPMKDFSSSSYYSNPNSGRTIEDFEEECPDAVCIISFGYKGAEFNPTNITSSLFFTYNYDRYIREEVIIPESYTNTINALKEAGVLNDKLEINEDSNYFKGYAEDYYYY